MPNSALYQTLIATNAKGGGYPNQIHTYAYPEVLNSNGILVGNAIDQIQTLGFQVITKSADGHHLRSGAGNDVFNFTMLGNVQNTIVGRFEDFDPTSDKIQINGVDIDFDNLPSNVRIVSYRGDNGQEVAPQQWLLITTSAGGHIFYALEGARVDLEGNGGANGGNQESHFITDVPSNAEFLALTDVQYENPFNFVPSGYQPDGGLVIHDVFYRDGTYVWGDHGLGDTTTPILGSGLGDLIAAGLNNDVVNAGGGNDRVWGGDGNDTIRGADGNDTLYGNAGHDSLEGGSGNDSMDGGAGSDLAFFYGATAVNVDLAAGTATGLGSDTLRSIENASGSSANDTLAGNHSANLLHGNQGDDALIGQGGADILYGGAGTDLMWGGANDGAVDTFVYRDVSESAPGSARDRIANFATGIDNIDLWVIDANTSASGNQAFSFSGTTARANSVWYTTSGADIIIRGDIDGNGIADFEILLRSISSMSAGDFVL